MVDKLLYKKKNTSEEYQFHSHHNEYYNHYNITTMITVFGHDFNDN